MELNFNVMGVNVLISKVIFVQNYCSSGSMYFSSLIDGHPEIVGLPGLNSIYLFSDAYFWDEAVFSSDAGSIAAALVQRQPFLFGSLEDDSLGLNRLGDKMDICSGCDINMFMLYFCHLYPQDDPSYQRFIATVCLSYRLALGGSVCQNMVLFLDFHSRPGAVLCFKNAGFDVAVVYVVRDPVVLFSSGVRHIIRHYWLNERDVLQYFVERFFVQLLFDHDWIYGQRCYGDRLLGPEWSEKAVAISLESLKTKAKTTMQRVVDWLGVDWDDCLLRSTFDGQLWWNRSGSLQTTTGRSDDIEQRRRAMLTSSDVTILSAATALRRKVWGYADDMPSLVVRVWRVLWPLSCECEAQPLTAPLTAWVLKRLPAALAKRVKVACLEETVRRTRFIVDQIAEEDSVVAAAAADIRHFITALSDPFGVPNWAERVLHRLLFLVADLGVYVRVRRLLIRAALGRDQPKLEEIPRLL